MRHLSRLRGEPIDAQYSHTGSGIDGCAKAQFANAPRCVMALARRSLAMVRWVNRFGIPGFFAMTVAVTGCAGSDAEPGEDGPRNVGSFAGAAGVNGGQAGVNSLTSGVGSLPTSGMGSLVAGQGGGLNGEVPCDVSTIVTANCQAAR
jgi:hypothetical protein